MHTGNGTPAPIAVRKAPRRMECALKPSTMELMASPTFAVVREGNTIVLHHVENTAGEREKRDLAVEKVVVVRGVLALGQSCPPQAECDHNRRE